MASDAYTTRGLPPAPHVSKTTIPMFGLLVDVYGLEELTEKVPVTCLHLLHPRSRTRARMSDVASRVISAYNLTASSSSRGLVAVAFDMPNHGSRMVNELGNQAWEKGNERHAVDMAGMVVGAGRDMEGVMELLGAYIGREVDGHVCLGWSLGGHAAWQGWLKEDRLDAVVVVVGCPDFMCEYLSYSLIQGIFHMLICHEALMSRRASTSNLALDNESFIGSKYFPPALISTCLTHDPRGLLFGLDPPTSNTSSSTSFDLSKLRSKQLLICSGADDKLVPHEVGVSFIQALRARGVESLDERVYEGVGHAFSGEMVMDAVNFLVEAVKEGPKKERARI